MKIFVAAAALEFTNLSPQTTFNCENGAYRIGKYTVHDVHRYGVLTPAGHHPVLQQHRGRQDRRKDRVGKAPPDAAALRVRPENGDRQPGRNHRAADALQEMGRHRHGRHLLRPRRLGLGRPAHRRRLRHRQRRRPDETPHGAGRHRPPGADPAAVRAGGGPAGGLRRDGPHRQGDHADGRPAGRHRRPGRPRGLHGLRQDRHRPQGGRQRPVLERAPRGLLHRFCAGGKPPDRGAGGDRRAPGPDLRRRRRGPRVQENRPDHAQFHERAAAQHHRKAEGLHGPRGPGMRLARLIAGLKPAAGERAFGRGPGGGARCTTAPRRSGRAGSSWR
ncbi:MAG: hypothetical protein MZV70_32870 [Desulfobacterales bacterium]|nr:hypothetical protein [Desulfobacterales bacterium]